MTGPFHGLDVGGVQDAPPARLPRSRRRAARPVTEHAVREACLRLLNQRGYAIVKHQTGAGQRGTPDILGCVAGRMVVIECKTANNDPTPAQHGKLRRWQDAGALAGWVRSVEHLQQLLDHLDDSGWRNGLAVPGDGRGAGEPW